MSFDATFGAPVEPNEETPYELLHWSDLEWSNANTLNELYELANDKNSLLRLAGHQFSGNELETLAGFISATKTITGLFLSRNNLGDAGAKLFINTLYQNGGGLHIKTLILKNNNLTSVSAKTLAPILLNPLCTIERLGLGRNPLNATAVKTLTAAMATNTSIIELDLSDCSLKSGAIKHLAKLLKFNVTMMQVHLKGGERNSGDNKHNISNKKSKAPPNSNGFSGTSRRVNRKEFDVYTKVVEKCVDRNLRIRYSRIRCGDILRRGTTPIKPQACRITLFGPSMAGKTGLAHALLDRMPVHFPEYHPTVSVATAVLQTFQKESAKYDDYMKNLEYGIKGREKFFYDEGVIPFDQPFALDPSSKIAIKGRGEMRFKETGEEEQIWRPKERAFGGLVAMCVQREAVAAAEIARVNDALIADPPSLGPMIDKFAPYFHIFDDSADNKKAKHLLPGVDFDALSIATDVKEDQSHLVLNEAVKQPEGNKYSSLFGGDEIFNSLDPQKSDGGVLGWGTEHDEEELMVAAKQKYNHYKPANGKSAQPPHLKVGSSKKALNMHESLHDLYLNPVVSEAAIMDISANILLLRSYFADTLVMNLFDMGGSVMAHMLAKFAMFKQGINILTFDMEQAVIGDLRTGDKIRAKLEKWFRIVKIFTEEEAPILVVGTRLDCLEYLAKSNKKKGVTGNFELLSSGQPLKKELPQQEANAVLQHMLKRVGQDFVTQVVGGNPHVVPNEEMDLPFFPMSNVSRSGVKHIRKACERVMRQISAEPTNYVPLRWMRLMELVFQRYAQDKDINWRIPIRSFAKMAFSLGMTSKAEVDLALKKFDEYGFILYKPHCVELTNWVILDPVPIFRSLMQFAKFYDVSSNTQSPRDQMMTMARKPVAPHFPTVEDPFEKEFYNELILMRKFGVVRKNLFKTLWKGGQQKTDLNYGVSWMKQNYFMCDFSLDGERMFLLPCFLEESPPQTPASLADEAAKQRFYFTLSFAQTGFFPSGLFPRLVALLFGCFTQENMVNTTTPISKSKTKLHSAYNLFNPEVNTNSPVFLGKEKIKILVGGQLLTMRIDGNELFVGLSQSRTAARIVVLLHSMLSKLNNDVFCGKLFWDVVFFYSSGKIARALPARPKQNRRRNPRAHHDRDLVEYTSDEEDDLVPDNSAMPRMVRMSFQEARSKKLHPFWQNEEDSFDECQSLWKGARVSDEARTKFADQGFPESVEDYCNRLRKLYLGTHF